MKTIFILDGDSAQQKSMNHHFTSMGFVVRSFFSAAEFDEVNEKPFLIILDEKMESKTNSGIQFLKKVHNKMSGVPVIYMASKPDRNLVIEVMDSGAYELIEKNSASFVNLRTSLDRLISQPPRTNWFARLFMKARTQNLPALSI